MPGNIDLYNRPKIPNPSGGMSTVYSSSFNIDGKEVLLPLADEGRILSPREAIDKYLRTGQHLGIFASPEAATAYAQHLHEDYAAGKYDRKIPAGADLLVPSHGLTQVDPEKLSAAVTALAQAMRRR